MNKKQSFFQSRTGLIILFLLVFVIFYGGANYFNSFRNEGFDPSIGIDAYIPFVSHFVYFYFATYIVVIAPFLFLKDPKDYYDAFKILSFTIIASSIFFVAFPTYMIRPEIALTSFSDKMVLLLWKIDQPHNLLPSLHVSASFLSAFICNKFNKKIGIVLIILALLISASTVFVKQHYILDVITGFLFAVMAYKLFNKLQIKQIEKTSAS